MRPLVLAALLLAAPLHAQETSADTLARLQAELAECRARNDRLVGIANDLIASYEARFRQRQSGPFQFARVRLETELQAQGELVHQNRVDAAPVRPAEPPKPASEPQPGIQPETKQQ